MNTDKYDRQLRLWQTQGQRTLQLAHILILQPTVTSLELLKNLVLPNIGSFTLIDTKRTIDEYDLGNNFYLNDNDIGKDRLDTLTSNVNELNWDVRGHYLNVNVPIHDFIKSKKDDTGKAFWDQYDLVVYNNHDENLVDLLYYLNIPLLIVNAIGFYGFLRIYNQNVKVIETHPETIIDLRILYPWKELTEYSNSIDIVSLDIEEQAKIPYLIIQLKAVDHWLKEHTGLPTSSKERQEFKKLIANWKKDYNLLNFDEAITNSHKIFNTVKVPDNIQEIFDHYDNLENKNNDEFWILINTLKKFVESNEGLLPLSGELPDMDSTTENYSILKKLYTEKFKTDLKHFTILLNNLTPNHQITDSTIKTFVKNSKHLYFRQNSKSRLDLDSFRSKILNDYGLADFEGNGDLRPTILGYILIDRFLKIQSKSSDSQPIKFPTIDDLEVQISEISPEIISVIPITDLRKALYEMTRGSGHELNNISSIIGGIAGQEALKLIMGQYVPLVNFFVFDGIFGKSGKIEL